MRWATITVTVATLGLSACGGGIPGLGSASSPVEPGAASQGFGTTARNLLLYGGTTVPPSQEPNIEPDYTCPEVGILQNGSAFRGNSGTGATAVTYQASLTNKARECAYNGKQVTIRVGVEGRLLLGENGRPGTYTVPVRIVVNRRSDIVTQRSVRLSVTVPANDSQAEFFHVEENITLPISDKDPGNEYDIFVGLDATGAQPQKQARRR